MKHRVVEARPLASLGLIVVVLFLLSIVDIPGAMLSLNALLILLSGWAFYLHRVIPQVSIAWPGVLTAIACLLGVLLLGHLFAAWLYRESGDSSLQRRWRFRWTVTGTLIILLMFVAGMSAVGITHQTAWLASADKNIVNRYDREHANRIKCSANLKQIHLALTLYANDHQHRLPDSLAELTGATDITTEVFVCPSSDQDKANAATTKELIPLFANNHCSYVYFAKGLMLPLDHKCVICCEPLSNHHLEGMNVLFGDGHVEFLDMVQAKRLLAPAATRPAY